MTTITDVLKKCYCRGDIPWKSSGKEFNLTKATRICLFYESIPSYVNNPRTQLMSIRKTRKADRIGITIGRIDSKNYCMAATLEYNDEINVSRFDYFAIQWKWDYDISPYILKPRGFAKYELIIHQLVASCSHPRGASPSLDCDETNTYLFDMMSARGLIVDNRQPPSMIHHQQINCRQDGTPIFHYGNPSGKQLREYQLEVSGKMDPHHRFTHMIKYPDNVLYMSGCPVDDPQDRYNREHNEITVHEGDASSDYRPSEYMRIPIIEWVEPPLMSNWELDTIIDGIINALIASIGINIFRIDDGTTVLDNNKLWELASVIAHLITDNGYRYVGRKIEVYDYIFPETLSRMQNIVDNMKRSDKRFDKRIDKLKQLLPIITRELNESDINELNESDINELNESDIEYVFGSNSILQLDLQSDKPSNSESMTIIDKTIDVVQNKTSTKSSENRDMTPRFNFHAEFTNVRDLSKSTVIFGEEGIGKTSLAKFCLDYECLIVEQLEDIKRFDTSIHSGIIFENIDFRLIKTSIIVRLICGDDRSYYCSDRSVVKIPCDIQLIFTTRIEDGMLFNPNLAQVYEVCQLLKVSIRPYRDVEVPNLKRNYAAVPNIIVPIIC